VRRVVSIKLKKGSVMRKYLLPLVAGALVAGAASAYAAQTTTNFTVQVSVTKACTVSASTMDFGNITVFSGQTAGSTVTSNCTLATPYDMVLTTPTVAMAGPGGNITATLGWDSYVEGTDAIGTGANQTFGITGTLPASGRAPDAGNYTGTATVNLNF
jgi:Spore Coat Protein U domain